MAFLLRSFTLLLCRSLSNGNDAKFYEWDKASDVPNQNVSNWLSFGFSAIGLCRFGIGQMFVYSMKSWKFPFIRRLPCVIANNPSTDPQSQQIFVWNITLAKNSTKSLQWFKIKPFDPLRFKNVDFIFNISSYRLTPNAIINNFQNLLPIQKTLITLLSFAHEIIFPLVHLGHTFIHAHDKLWLEIANVLQLTKKGGD